MRPSVKRAAGILAGISLLPAAAWAYQPLVTDDTGTQGAGGNQIEIAYTRSVNRTAGSRVVTHAAPLAYARGITDALDLTLGLPWQRIVPDAPAPAERGWGNVVLGAKWRFHDDEGSKLSFAFKPEVALPVSDRREARGLGTARTSYRAGLLMTRETGFGAVHANAAVERIRYSDDMLDAAERRTRYRVSVAPVWDVAGGWKLALDAGLVTNPDRALRARMGYVELGAIHSPGKDLDLALGLVRNVRDGEARSTQAIAGATWRFR
jgi:hypothetical protein